MTACRLIFNSFAALSSSSSIGEEKSTFTRCIGPIMRPLFVKKVDTLFPSSANRAIASAETGFFLAILFIQFLFFLGCLPKRYKVVILALAVFSDFEDDGIQTVAHPADDQICSGRSERWSR